MDEATYQTINTMAGGDTSAIEYWDVHKSTWTKEKQPKEAIRIPGIVHEASTAFVGPKEEGGSLDDSYRPHGVKNVVCALPAFSHPAWEYPLLSSVFLANFTSLVCDRRCSVPVGGELEPHADHVRIRARFSEKDLAR